MTEEDKIKALWEESISKPVMTLTLGMPVNFPNGKRSVPGFVKMIDPSTREMTDRAQGWMLEVLDKAHLMLHELQETVKERILQQVVEAGQQTEVVRNQIRDGMFVMAPPSGKGEAN